MKEYDGFEKSLMYPRGESKKRNASKYPQQKNRKKRIEQEQSSRPTKQHETEESEIMTPLPCL